MSLVLNYTSVYLEWEAGSSLEDGCYGDLVNRYRLTFPSFCCYLVFELNQEGVYYNVLRTRNFTEKIYDYL